MRKGSVAGLIFLLGLLASPIPGHTLDLTQRSVSNSQQFIVYSPDVRLRMAVTSFVETAKAATLQTLGLQDHWKLPIIVNIQRPAAADTGRPLCQVALLNTEGGAKVEINIALREDQLKEVRFPQQIIRAVLLELAYRNQLPKEGAHYAEPPVWLVEGIAERFQARASNTGQNTALFKQLIGTGRLPKIRDFLASNVEAMDSTSREVYAASAWSLVEMLSGLPEGKENLARMIRDLGHSKGDATDLLLQHFPTLKGNEASLEKWWTLGIARYAAADRHLGLSLAETDSRLSALMTLQVVTDPKTGSKTPFPLADYAKFIKLKTARPALLAQGNSLAALLPQSHPLLRPVLIEYQRIVVDLAAGKTRRADESLREVANYRAMIVERMDKIADYLNWFEATQMPERSGAFDAYLKTATALETAEPPKRNDAISRYVEQVERECE